MVARGTKSFLLILTAVCGVFLPTRVCAQDPIQGSAVSGPIVPGATGLGAVVQSVNLDIYIKGPNGESLEGAAVVTLMRLNGQVYKQGTAKAGYVRLNDLAPTEYNVQVVAPGFTAVTKRVDTQGSALKVTIQLEPATDAAAKKQLEVLQGAMASNSSGRIEGARGADNMPEGVPELVDVTNLSRAAIPPPLKDLIQPEIPVSEKRALSEGARAQLAPKVEQALRRAYGILGSNLTAQGAAEARKYLETAYRAAPANAEVNYLFGIYSQQVYKRDQAKSYWAKALELNPKHYRALLSLSQALLDENKAGEAMPLLERAIDAEPFSWRAYGLLADAYLLQGNFDQSAKESEHAIELGHREAAVVQRYLAAALAEGGERDKAISMLESYVGEHRGDIGARKQLDKLRAAGGQSAKDAADASTKELLEPGAVELVSAHPLPINWAPADIDKDVPPVAAGSTCALDKVVQMAGRRIEEFVANVDRFAATELQNYESINNWGLDLFSKQWSFDYVVSIHEMKPGIFDVEEFRKNKSPGEEAPADIQSNGLPAMVLIFHPRQTENFEFTCEGLARTKNGLAWQVHFRQRADKPNTMRRYQIGMAGQSYRVDMKGRVWISAESYQVLRMETQMVAPVQEIRLTADYTAIEYGPVHFRGKNIDMWLPQSAEVYSDWKGRRFHQRHSFSKYMLFSVDDKQTISAPKTAEATPPKPDGARPNQ